MSFEEDFEEFLDESGGFACFCTVIPAAGKPYLIKGIFSNEYLDIDGGMAGFGSSSPIFECAAKAVETVRYGDFLDIDRVIYRIVCIKPDGTGWVKLELERQD